MEAGLNKCFVDVENLRKSVEWEFSAPTPAIHLVKNGVDKGGA